MAASAVVRWIGKAARCMGGRGPEQQSLFHPSDMSPALQTRLLVLQPTPFCNIACDYCYLPDRNLKARMSLATLRLVGERLVEDALLGRSLDVVWHAGEPMVLPPDWYEEAMTVLAGVLGSRCALTHSIQTNGTLVTDAWCDLIKRWRIRVGVSLDGPSALHDAHRRTRGGKGTHARVLDGLARLREAGIDFHVIAVVTQATLSQPDAFIDFFEGEGIERLGCNFDEVEGGHSHSSLAGHEDAHADFLARMMGRMTGGEGTLAVRELLAAKELLSSPLPQYRWRDRRWPDNVQVVPFALLSVAHDGRFSTFSPELLGQPAVGFDDFVFGNVAEGSYLAALDNNAFQRAWGAIARGIAACETQCAHFAYCGGGAPANKLYELGDMAGTETLYCRTMLKRPFDAVLERLEADLAPPAAVEPQ